MTNDVLYLRINDVCIALHCIELIHLRGESNNRFKD